MEIEHIKNIALLVGGFMSLGSSGVSLLRAVKESNDAAMATGVAWLAVALILLK